jgi:hypothetical protein
MLEIELYRRNRIKNCNNVGLIEEINLEVANMREKLEINDSGYDFNNISEIL